MALLTKINKETIINLELVTSAHLAEHNGAPVLIICFTGQDELRVHNPEQISWLWALLNSACNFAAPPQKVKLA